jgi:hypothetical protein
MGKMQREKGKAGERELARLLTQLTGKDVRRRVRQHDSDSDLVGLEPWSIECKRAKVLKLPQWWAQTVAQQGEDGWPVLMWRKDQTTQWWVRCRFGDAVHAAGISSAFFVGDTSPIDMALQDWVVVVGLERTE